MNTTRSIRGTLGQEGTGRGECRPRIVFGCGILAEAPIVHSRVLEHIQGDFDVCAAREPTTGSTYRVTRFSGRSRKMADVKPDMASEPINIKIKSGMCQLRGTTDFTSHVQVSWNILAPSPL